MEVFKKQLDVYGDAIILDNYIPADGTYLLVGQDGSIITKQDIKYDKKTKSVNLVPFYKQFCFYDYHSSLIDMNKPVDSKKVVHSNSYLSFFIKKDSLVSGKLDLAAIDRYYNALVNMEEKYKKNKGKELYDTLINEIGEIEISNLEWCRNWIKQHIFELEQEGVDLSKKDYLKIFFERDDEVYVKEGNRYLVPNLYNSNDYNVLIGDEIYGLPNNNLGMNQKKPYLSSKTRKTPIPYLVTSSAALEQKKFFDYLLNFAKLGKYNIYVNFNNNKIKAYENDEMPLDEISGYFIRIQKGKEVEIHNQEVIPFYSNRLSEIFTYKDYVMSTYEEKSRDPAKYGTYNTRSSIHAIINDVLFSKFLGNNYFTKPEDMSITDGYLKDNLLLARETIFNWAYKGNDYGMYPVLKRVTLSLIKGSIIKGYNLKAIRQFNLRWSLLNYFSKGEEKMADKFFSVRERLKEKIMADGSNILESDEEYYYAIGQLVSYFISLNKSKNKMQSLVNPFINAKSNNMLKEKLRQFYKKYNYSINDSNKRFNHLYEMIISYDPDGKVNQDLIILGYVSDNLIYFKEEKQDE